MFVETTKEIYVGKLSYLSKLVALKKTSLDTECFQRLLEQSPNLHYLDVNYKLLQPLLDNESVCLLLKRRITHLYISISSVMILELVISSMPQLASTLSSLKHLYFTLDKRDQTAESLILAVLNSLSKWNSLVSFGIVDVLMKEETLSKGIQQWVMENSILHEHTSFAVDYTNKTFRLWL